MKSKVTLTIETVMNKKMMNGVKDEDGKASNLSFFEKSIHGAIPRVLNEKDIEKKISEVINEGGWIEDVEGYEFPKDYCKFSVKIEDKKSSSNLKIKQKLEKLK